MAKASSIRRIDNKYKSKMEVIGWYIDTCIKIFVVVFLADVVRRLFMVFYEWKYYKNRYLPESGYSLIAKRSFTYNKGTCTSILVFFIVAVIRFGCTARFPLPPIVWLTFMPLYWCGSLLGFSHSTLTYANWIREPHGLDYGAGMASNYYHGYLKLTLPSYKDHLGIRERIENYENSQQVKFAVNRLVILIPDTMFTSGKIESPRLEKAKPLETIVKMRAGVARPFKNDVYRFELHNQSYYVAMEGATPLVSFFDALNFPMSSTWQMQEMRREIWFQFYKTLKALCMGNPDTEQEVELIPFNSHTANGQRQDIGELLIAHMEMLWNMQPLKYKHM